MTLCRALKGIVIVALFLGLSACFSPVKLPETTLYRLDPKLHDMPMAKQVVNKILLISPVQSVSGFATDQMAYIDAPYQVSYFANNHWLASPAEMLQPLIVASLSKAKIFKAVVVPPFASTGQWRLDVKVVELAQDFLKKPSQERLVVQVQLFDMTKRHVIATDNFDVTVPAPSDDPQGGVMAANQAVLSFLTKLNKFCMNAVSIHR